MTKTRLTDEQLNRREDWETAAENAYQQPDEQVLAMIEEIREWRKKYGTADEGKNKQPSDGDSFGACLADYDDPRARI